MTLEIPKIGETFYAQPLEESKGIEEGDDRSERPTYLAFPHSAAPGGQARIARRKREPGWAAAWSNISNLSPWADFKRSGKHIVAKAGTVTVDRVFKFGGDKYDDYYVDVSSPGWLGRRGRIIGIHEFNLTYGRTPAGLSRT